MTKKRALSVLLVVVAAITVAQAAPVYRPTRYCLVEKSSGRWKTSSHRINVRLHESLLDLCGGHPDSCQADDLAVQRFKIERAVRTALADFHNASGANLRFDFRGWTSSDRLRDDTILLAHFNTFSSDDCPADNGIAMAQHVRQPWYLGGDDRGRVLFCTRIAGGQAVRWIPWGEGDDGDDRLGAFIPVVKHEILHVLGLNHSTTCSSPLDPDAINSTLMRPNGFTFMHLGREDVRFLRDHFGVRRTDGHLRVSSNGRRWSSAAEAPSEAEESLGRPAATNSREGSTVFVGWRDASENSIRVSRVTLSGTWRVRSTVESLNALYSPALASTSNGQLVLAYQSHDAGAASNTLRTVVRVSQDGGESWTSAFTLADSRSFVPGISATHDPDTNQWLTVTAGRRAGDRGWRIKYASIGPGHEPRDLGSSFITANVPALACAPRDETDSFNCVLAWHAGRWEGGIDWTQCRVTLREDGAELECLPARRLGFVSVGAPTLTYGGPGGGFPWQLALSQGGGAIYTWRKAAGPNAEWVDERSFSFPPEAGIPALGAADSVPDRRFLAALAKQ